MQVENSNKVLELTDIRGFDALVQGDNEVVDMLVEEYEKSDNKVVSFHKVRDKVLTDMFATDSLEDFLTMSLNRHNGNKKINIPSDMVDSLQKALCERIIRDHVPISAIEDLEKSILLLYSKYDKNAPIVLEKVRNYMQSNRPKFAHVLKKALDILDDHEESRPKGIIA